MRVVHIAVALVAAVAGTSPAHGGGYEYDYVQGSGTVVQPDGTYTFSITARATAEFGETADGTIRITTATGSLSADVDCLTIENFLTGRTPFGTAGAVIIDRSGTVSGFEATDQLIVAFQDNDQRDAATATTDTVTIRPEPSTSSSCDREPGLFALSSGEIRAYDRDL